MLKVTKYVLLDSGCENMELCNPEGMTCYQNKTAPKYGKAEEEVYNIMRVSIISARFTVPPTLR